MNVNSIDSLQELHHFFLKGYLEYRPNLFVHCAIFGYHDGELKLLLVKSNIITQWCLPGHFVRRDEGLDQAAARVTVERTGLENLFLKQFKAFSDPQQSKSDAFDADKLFELTGVRLPEDSWLKEQQVSVGYYAITDLVNARPKADSFSSECRWFPVSNLPPLGYNHNEMAQEALITMRMHLYHFPIGKSLLPRRFTLKEIKQFYEVMSGKSLHVSNFPNKLIGLGLIQKTDEKRPIGAHRSPTYYYFTKEAYDQALKEGLVLV